MKTQKDVWIDHRKAIVVTITRDGQEMALVISNAEQQFRATEEPPVNGACAHVPKNGTPQQSDIGHMNIFYDAVTAALSGAGSILLLGPGEAKVELLARLEACSLAEYVVGIQTTTPMTDRQLASWVRMCFETLTCDVEESRPVGRPLVSSLEPKQ